MQKGTDIDRVIVYFKNKSLTNTFLGVTLIQKNFFLFQIGYRPGSKNTAAALKYVRKRMFTPRTGDRSFAKNYVIMLTGEGTSTDPFAAATEACELQVIVI